MVQFSCSRIYEEKISLNLLHEMKSNFTFESQTVEKRDAFAAVANLVNVILLMINHLHINLIAFYSTCKGNKIGTKSII